ncbi:MAG TPA: galactokinase [Longimicrobiales bacterium]
MAATAVGGHDTDPGRTPAAGRARTAFRAAFGGEPDVLARAPGRVNLIGEHVDYNGGCVLPVAIDRDVVVAARRRPDRRILAVAADLRGEDAFALDGLTEAGAGWARYVRGVAALLEASGVRLRGAELAIAGDVPAGAGLSSSAALEVACATALLGIAGASIDGPELASLCRRAEIEWAGVQCGIMDPFVSALGRADHALFLDCRSLEHRHIAIPPGVRVIATDSGVRRQLRHSAFNDRVRETREAARLLGVPELRDIDAAEFERREAELPEPLRRRARHVVREIERTRAAARALRAGDLARFGQLLAESHASARDDYEVSVAELDALVAAASIDGVYGTRLSGAGFGGCTVSVVAEEAVAEFIRRVPATYRAATGRTATVHVCRAAAGASLVPPAAAGS